MKNNKIVVLALIIAVCAVFLCGCKTDDGNTGYAQYFKDFTSASAYTSVTPTLTLPDGVAILSYDDDNGVFITKKTYSFGDTDYVRYGFCTATENLLAPMYAHVVDINGDYAIVVKTIADGAKTYARIGVVKFRGDYKGREFGFSYTYSYLITQYGFLNDNYLSVLGSIDYTDDDLDASSTGTYSYATIYDYTSAKGEAILELGRVGKVDNESTFVLQDDVLTVMGTNVYYFYNVNSAVQANGGFPLLKSYVPFDEDDGYTASYVDCDASYVGNNWFILTAYYMPTEAPDYYEMEYYDDENKVTYYMTIRSIRYNPVLGTSLSCDRIVLVANSYSSNYINELADSANVDESYYDEDDPDSVTYYYATPVMPTSEIIKEGYTLAYYYYPVFSNGVVTGSYSFCIMDSYANIINITDLLFPLVTVDGVAIQSPDPNFNIPFAEAAYYSLSNEKTLLADVAADSNGKKYEAYYVTCPSSGMVLAYAFNTTTVSTMMGAFDTTTNTQTVPFEYADLSIFVGNYATGIKYEITDAENNKYVQHFYRVGKDGTSEELSDCIAIKNGVYVTKGDGSYGLKANDGTVLLNNTCKSVSVVQNYLVDGVNITTQVFTVEENPETGATRGVIYSIK